MQAVTATEFARNFSQMLNQVEHQGVTISIVRNHKQIATLAPQLHHQSAMEAFGDLYRPMEHTVNDDWMTDIQRVNQSFNSQLSDPEQDPWQ